MELRDYQQKAVEEIRNLYKQGNKKVLLHAPTGSGKGCVTAHIMESMASSGKKCLFVVHGRSLVNLASERFPMDHGVLMAGHKKFDLSKNIQICSIDTINARELYPETSLVLIDEVHMAQSDSYKKLAERYKDSFFLGFSATPYTRKPINHICEHVVKTITHEELIKLGFLVKAEYYCAQKLNLAGIKIASTGDYKEDELSEFMEQDERAANVAPNWLKYGQNRPTICFAVTVKHSKTLCAHFKNHGIEALHLDASSTDKERKEASRKLSEGEIKVIVNVGIMHVGIDIPAVSCVVHCRPTKSLIWYIQACGRGTRPSPGKENLIILDMANNVIEHGFIEVDRDAILNGVKKKTTHGLAPVKMCPVCFRYVAINAKECPECHHVFEVKEKEEKKSVSVDMFILENDYQSNLYRATIEKRKLEYIVSQNFMKPGFIYYKLLEKYGKEMARKLCPYKRAPEASARDTIREF